MRWSSRSTTQFASRSVFALRSLSGLRSRCYSNCSPNALLCHQNSNSYRTDFMTKSHSLLGLLRASTGRRSLHVHCACVRMQFYYARDAPSSSTEIHLLYKLLNDAYIGRPTQNVVNTFRFKRPLAENCLLLLLAVCCTLFAHIEPTTFGSIFRHKRATGI